ncbi:hypothetical protein ACFL4G_07845 [Thermodesulfobacteriota bacterium]
MAVNGWKGTINMKALIIAAHGSRLDESNGEVIALAEEIERSAKDRFDFGAHFFNSPPPGSRPSSTVSPPRG